MLITFFCVHTYKETNFQKNIFMKTNFMNFDFYYKSYSYQNNLVALCTTGPRRADNNASSLDRRDAPLGLAEL